jgi:hypothetical protein
MQSIHNYYMKQNYTTYSKKDVRKSGLIDLLAGFASIHFYGVEGDKRVMVVDLLGDSIEDLIIQCNGKFSMKTTLMIADQMVLSLRLIPC